MKVVIRAVSQIGTHNGIQYGQQDDGDMRYYFRGPDGTMYFADTEEEIQAIIDKVYN